MLFVGCSSCRSIGPLWCGGQPFVPHGPVPAEPSAWGPMCRFCGVMSPYFTCMRCGAVQLMFLAGTSPPQTMLPGQLVAPVVHAPEGAGEGQIASLLGKFAREGGKGFGEAMIAWVSS